MCNVVSSASWEATGVEHVEAGCGFFFSFTCLNTVRPDADRGDSFFDITSGAEGKSGMLGAETKKVRQRNSQNGGPTLHTVADLWRTECAACMELPTFFSYKPLWNMLTEQQQ